MNTSDSASEPRRGWGVKKIVLAVVIVAVVIVGGFFFIGLLAPIETLVASVAVEKNAHRGKQVDPVTWFDEADADGPLLIVRYTVIDGWFDATIDAMGEDLAEVLGRSPDPAGVLSVMEMGSLKAACDERASLGKPEARVLFEYRDERGEPLYSVEAGASTC